MTPKQERKLLDILESAISDVGVWNYWKHRLPKSIQLEFLGAQLYRGRRICPENHIRCVALRFNKPTCAIFMRFKSPNRLPRDWPDRLASDRLRFQPAQFLYINQPKSIPELLTGNRANIKTHGKPLEDWKKAPVTLQLIGPNVGVVVAAKSFEIVTLEGKIPLSSVLKHHAAWWGYWEKYWDRKDTPKALPYDHACELTIPAD